MNRYSFIDNKGKGIWARLTNFYATSGAGVFFIQQNETLLTVIHTLKEISVKVSRK